MRYSFVAFAIAAMVVAGAGSAQATSLSLSFSNLSGTADGTVNGNEVSDLAVGDQVEITINVDNTSGNPIQALFTFLNTTPGILELNQAVALPVPPEVGFSTDILTPLAGFGEQNVIGPAGQLLGLAHQVLPDGVADDAYSNAVSFGAVAIVFNVVGLGVTDIVHVDDASVVGGSGLSFDGGPLTVVVPEPGTALLMGLGLAGLAAAGRRE